MPDLLLYGCAGCGSVIAEAALRLTGTPYDYREVDLFDDDPHTPETLANAEALAGVNPMRQVPTLVLPTGEVMTESAAILLWLGDLHPEIGLAPFPTDPARAAYLRWLLYIPGQIYPMYWVKDVPDRLAGPDPVQQKAVSDRAVDRIEACWRAMGEQLKPSPFILGPSMSLLDVYVAVVSRWTPGRRSFYALAPSLADLVRRVDADPRLQALWADRFPFDAGWER